MPGNEPDEILATREPHRRPGGTVQQSWNRGTEPVFASQVEQATSRDIQYLLKRVASHDRDAFHQLYSATSARIFGIVLKVVRDRRISEEVTQEVYLEIWKTAPRFDPERGSGIGWMLMLAHSRAVDRVRYEERQIPCLPLEDSSCDAPFSAEDSDELHFDFVPVRSAVARLPAQQRTVVALAFYQGLSHRQVAEQLDIPLGTMKTRMRRALIKLRSTLG